MEEVEEEAGMDSKTLVVDTLEIMTGIERGASIKWMVVV
jgi:hypothetical protein